MNVIRIPLTRGQEAVIDPADYGLVKGYSWRCAEDYGRLEYAVTTAKQTDGSRRTVRMHSLIMGAKPGQAVDHINGDGLDNRRQNLRFADDRRNQANQHSVRGRSRFKGVYLKSGRWCAKIKERGTQQHLGYFDDEVDAAIAYDQAALKMHGEFANPNFPRRVHERLAGKGPQAWPCAISVCSRLEGDHMVSAELPIWACSSHVEYLRKCLLPPEVREQAREALEEVCRLTPIGPMERIIFGKARAALDALGVK